MQFNLTKDKSLTAGFWGGGSFNGDYKEFDYFVSYAKKGLSLLLWDVNNFSDYERSFGGLWIPSTMSYAVRDFFSNGGSQARAAVELTVTQTRACESSSAMGPYSM